ncbi:MAG TPA: ABC transporter permease [Acetobacteraceae bacterium]|nr:ABC transporter permease [Acetobacteraceae bacterium]
MAGFRILLAPRLEVSHRMRAATLAAGVAAGLAISALFLVLVGVPLGDLWSEVVLYTFTDPSGLDQTITRAIPLILVGLSVAVVLRVRFWNIGVEGQAWMGALATTAVSLYAIGPMPLHLPLMFAGAALAGAFWCGLCAWARLRLKADEVITTLLLNYVAYYLTQHLLYGAWRNPNDSYPTSPDFAPGETLPGIGFGHVHAGLLIALAAVGFCWWLCSASRIGLMARAIANNPVAARAVGIPVERVVLLVAMLAGALSGLAGFSLVAGTEHRLTQFIGQDYIFPSIVIAYLGRSHPLGVLIAAFAIAGLYTAGDSLKAFYQLPGAVVLTVEAMLLLTVTAFDFFLRYRVSVLRAARPAVSS